MGLVQLPDAKGVASILRGAARRQHPVLRRDHLVQMTLHEDHLVVARLRQPAQE
jgi:hypothetical protein